MKRKLTIFLLSVIFIFKMVADDFEPIYAAKSFLYTAEGDLCQVYVDMISVYHGVIYFSKSSDKKPVKVAEHLYSVGTNNLFLYLNLNNEFIIVATSNDKLRFYISKDSKKWSVVDSEPFSEFCIIRHPSFLQRHDGIYILRINYHNSDPGRLYKSEDLIHWDLVLKSDELTHKIPIMINSTNEILSVYPVWDKSSNNNSKIAPFSYYEFYKFDRPAIHKYFWPPKFKHQAVYKNYLFFQDSDDYYYLGICTSKRIDSNKVNVESSFYFSKDLERWTEPFHYSVEILDQFITDQYHYVIDLDQFKIDTNENKDQIDINQGTWVPDTSKDESDYYYIYLDPKIDEFHTLFSLDKKQIHKYVDNYFTN